MGEILAFHQSKTASRVPREPISTSADIVFFPGVRYERMEEAYEPLKPSSRRAVRRREKQKKEKAS